MMTEYKKCDGCGAKYRGNACPYCMVVEDAYKFDETVEDLYFLAGTPEPNPYLYGDCWPKATHQVSVTHPGKTAKEFDKVVTKNIISTFRQIFGMT